jgi:hypothetical protein
VDVDTLAAALQCFGDQLVVVAVAVASGRIEEVDAEVEGAM